MSQVSKKVIAVGFGTHHNGAKLVKDALSRSAEVYFVDRPRDQSEFAAAHALILSPSFDFESKKYFEIISNCVRAGANLFILGLSHSGSSLWQELTGVTPVDCRPDGEWFFKTSASSPLTRRLPAEFAAVGILTPYEVHDGAEALLATSIAFIDRTTAAVRRLPSATICTLGLNPTSEHVSQDLAAIVRRAVLSEGSRLGFEEGAELGIGIVGYGPYGGMGSYHAAAASDVTGMNLVAVVDQDPERRKAAEQEFPNVRTYSTVRELAQDDDVDICIVATPPVNHAEISMTLLDSKKHVISEKPMCLNLKEANELISKAKAMDRMLSVNQNRRWDRDFRAIAKAVSDNKVGNLFNIETFVGGFEHPCRAWHSEESVSGGAIFDWGSHHIDWITQLYGSTPAKVSMTQHKRVWHDVTNMDQIRVHMLWDDGREAQFFQSDIAAIRKPKYFIQGTSGTIVGTYRPITEETVVPPFGFQEREYHYAEAPATLRLSRYESEAGLIEEPIPLEKPNKFAFHKNIVDHLLLGEPLAVDPESVAASIAILEAAQYSSTTDSEYIAISEVKC